jgi:hypothetical protein
MKKLLFTTLRKVFLTVSTLWICQFLHAQTWSPIRGVQAQDISIGSGGEAWIIGKDNSIMRWNGSAFDKIKGSARRISVGSDGIPWIVTSSGKIGYYDSENDKWVQVAGSAKDIGVGAEGSVWIVGTKAVDGGFEVSKWNSEEESWDIMEFGAIRIAVDGSGNPWMVNDERKIIAYMEEELHEYGEESLDVGIGADGTVWAITSEKKIVKLGDDGWIAVNGNAIGIAATSEGSPWIVNSIGQVAKLAKLVGEEESDSDEDVADTNEEEKEAEEKPKQAKPVRVKMVEKNEQEEKSNVAKPNRVKTVEKNEEEEEKDDQPKISGPSAKTKKVLFQNTGEISAKLYRTTNDNKKTFVSEIAANSGIYVDAKLREGFTVELDAENLFHRKLYVVDPDQTLFIYGNVAMKDYKGFGSNFPNLNYEPSLVGVDTTTLLKSNLVLSMKDTRTRIFEGLNATRGIDYESQPPYLIKAGFYYAGVPLTISTDKVRMSYGSSAFSEGWNIGASGKFPVGKSGVDVGVGLGYGQTQSSQSNQTDIYAYTRTQVLTNMVQVAPAKAYLDPIFMDRVRKIASSADARKFIIDYGTHYPDMIFYGGEMSCYLRMSSSEYTKAKSMNLNIAAEVEKSSPGEKTKNKSGDTTRVSPPSSHGGKMDFSMTTNEEHRNFLQKSESKARVIGGEYSRSGDYNVNEGNAVPVALTMRRIDELIDSKIFKDDTDPAVLSRIRNIVSDELDIYITEKIPANRTVEIPPPNEYIVTLISMAVTGHIDDANANTKGSVTASAFTDATLKTKIAHPRESFWSQGDYSLDFRFSPNNNKSMEHAPLYFTHFANPETGRFNPFYLNIAANIVEKDDIVWAPDGAKFSGGSGPIDLNALNLKPGGPAVTRTLDLQTPGNGSIRLTYTIRREESPFTLPDIMDQWVSNAGETIIDADSNPAEEAVFTLINAGGYAAKYNVSYTLEGQPQSYDSGEVPLGWKYKLPVPPNAQNVRIEAFYNNGGWKSIFADEPKTVDNKCYKVVGTIFNAKVEYKCD